MNLGEQVALAPYTTLRIGGPARFFARVESERDLLDAIYFARARDLPVFLLGGGSNLLVADEGFPGVVVQFAPSDRIVLTSGAGTTQACVDAAVPWDTLVDRIAAAGLCGLECLAGIPGSVGASPVQNIGAYGQEVAQTIASVRALDLNTLAFTDLGASKLGFAYRTSIFNSSSRGRYVITAVTFTFFHSSVPRLDYADLQSYFAGRPTPTPAEVVAAVRQIRARKGMYIDPAHPDDPDTRSAGSFFKNPVVAAPIYDSLAASFDQMPHWPAADGCTKLSAAWLIERAGFPRGFALGAAGISSRHTLALVNRTGSATCAELLALRDLIRGTVASRFGVTLEQEPVMLGG